MLPLCVIRAELVKEMVKVRRQFLKKGRDTPEIVLSPMIDLIFLLLVFFIVSTMHMVDTNAISINLPKTQHVFSAGSNKFLLTVKKDGSVYLADRKMEMNSLIAAAVAENNRNSQFAVVIRADGDVDYKMVVRVLDELQGAGIRKFGLATDNGG